MWDGCYFARGGKVTNGPGHPLLPSGAIHLERRRGTVPMIAYAERALIVTCPPDPHFTGAGHFGHLISFGGLSFDCAFLSSRPTGAYCN